MTGTTTVPASTGTSTGTSTRGRASGAGRLGRAGRSGGLAGASSRNGLATSAPPATRAARLSRGGRHLALHGEPPGPVGAAAKRPSRPRWSGPRWALRGARHARRRSGGRERGSRLGVRASCTRCSARAGVAVGLAVTADRVRRTADRAPRRGAARSSDGDSGRDGRPRPGSRPHPRRRAAAAVRPSCATSGPARPSSFTPTRVPAAGRRGNDARDAPGAPRLGCSATPAARRAMTARSIRGGAPRRCLCTRPRAGGVRETAPSRPTTG